MTQPLGDFNGLTPAEARRVLAWRASVNLTRLARKKGLHRPTLSNVLAGRKRSRRSEVELARALGLSLREAFPEWYGPSDPAARPSTINGAPGAQRKTRKRPRLVGPALAPVAAVGQRHARL